VPSFDHCSPGKGDAGPTVGTLGQELQDRKIKTQVEQYTSINF
jgi:hypothetical protein